MEDEEKHREFLLMALRAASARAKLLEADINTIGLALKGNMINSETAVRWIIDANLLWMVGSLPADVGKMSPQDPPKVTKAEPAEQGAT
jgi:hypothetical protein